MRSIIDMVSSTLGCALVPYYADPSRLPLIGRILSSMFSIRRRMIIQELGRSTVSSVEFVRKLAGVDSLSVLQVLGEWHTHSSLGWLRQQGVDTSVTPVLYALTRILKPSVVIETGVAAGVSSTAFLTALSNNKFGKLYSIEAFRHPPSTQRREAGWIVPKELRSRWSLLIGRSEEKLPSLIKEVGRIDIFLHDSNHTYNIMWFEFESAWRNLELDGVLLSHDAEANRSFLDFSIHLETKPLVAWNYDRSRPIALAGLRKSFVPGPRSKVASNSPDLELD